MFYELIIQTLLAVHRMTPSYVLATLEEKRPPYARIII